VEGGYLVLRRRRVRTKRRRRGLRNKLDARLGAALDAHSLVRESTVNFLVTQPMA
jgi:hypothetical protein